MKTNDNFEHNRKSWNELTRLHVKSAFYDVYGFNAGQSSLNHIELQELGDVSGKNVLHLQCHFGLDTLSLARLGAKVVGVDISDESIHKARELADRNGLDAKFVRSNVYDAQQVLDDQFDIVYTSYGAINWLDDLDKWAGIIHHFLKQGGMFYMVEFHPFVYTMDDQGGITGTYFKSISLETNVESSYTDNSHVANKSLKHVEWHHSLSEVVNSLLRNGLKIEFMNEFPYQVYNCFPNLIEIENGKWVFEKYKSKIPYMYSIKAWK